MPLLWVHRVGESRDWQHVCFSTSFPGLSFHLLSPKESFQEGGAPEKDMLSPG
jgi:hypothetical protein